MGENLFILAYLVVCAMRTARWGVFFRNDFAQASAVYVDLCV